MEAVAEGVTRQGGVAIGLLPDATPDLPNPFLTHVIATGIGEAHNVIIARSAFCLVAIGNSHGTLSEVALGLQFGKEVFGLEGAAQLEEVTRCAGDCADSARGGGEAGAGFYGMRHRGWVQAIEAPKQRNRIRSDRRQAKISRPAPGA